MPGACRTFPSQPTGPVRGATTRQWHEGASRDNAEAAATISCPATLQQAGDMHPISLGDGEGAPFADGNMRHLSRGIPEQTTAGRYVEGCVDEGETGMPALIVRSDKPIVRAD